MKNEVNFSRLVRGSVVERSLRIGLTACVEFGVGYSYDLVRVRSLANEPSETVSVLGGRRGRTSVGQSSTDGSSPCWREATHTSMNLRPLDFSMSFCRSDIQTGSSFSLNETSRAASRSRSKPGVEKAQTHRWSAFSHQHPKARRLERTLDAALKLGELGDKVV